VSEKVPEKMLKSSRRRLAPAMADRQAKSAAARALQTEVCRDKPFAGRKVALARSA
jgi:hypothetical protein